MANYYAVKNGRTPGLYGTWAECEAQVKGFNGAKFKKFSTLSEAEAFVSSVETTVLNTIETITEPIYAFVDGSFNPATKVYGYGGFLSVNGKKYVLQGHNKDEEMATMRNVAGEICGSMAAVKKAEELGIKELTILYDYKGIEEWVKGTWRANKKGTIEYADFMRNTKVNITFKKVEAHTGIEGNEMADVLAKNAVGIALTPSQQTLLDKIKEN